MRKLEMERLVLFYCEFAFWLSEAMKEGGGGLLGLGASISVLLCIGALHENELCKALP